MCAPLAIVLPLAWATGIASRDQLAPPAAQEPGPNAPRLLSTLDPNAAPWWELSALPRLGEATAQRIVDHRRKAAAEQPGRPVFRDARDLEDVRGIGPKTVAALSPHLRFGPRDLAGHADADGLPDAAFQPPE